jgi:hypothetical protein
LSETTRREFLKDAALVGAAVGSGTFAEGNLFGIAAQARTTAPAAGRKQSRSPGLEASRRSSVAA